MLASVQIRYTITEDDLEAYFRHQIENSHEYQTAYRRVFWARLVAGIVVFGGIFLITRDSLWACASVGALVALALITRIGHRRAVSKRAHAAAREGKNAAILSERVLEITPEGLHSRTPVSESRIAWSAFEKLVSTDAHTFIYMQTVGAHIVPHAALTTEELARFRQTLDDALAHASVTSAWGPRERLSA